MKEKERQKSYLIICKPTQKQISSFLSLIGPDQKDVDHILQFLNKTFLCFKRFPALFENIILQIVMSSKYFKSMGNATQFMAHGFFEVLGRQIYRKIKIECFVFVQKRLV